MSTHIKAWKLEFVDYSFEKKKKSFAVWLLSSFLETEVTIFGYVGGAWDK